MPLDFAHSPAYGALAVMLLTMLVRLAVLPLSVRRARAQRARAGLAPQLLDLQKRHAGDPDRLRTELAAVYRDAGTGPFAGMLPTLAQAPAFMLLYHAVTSSAFTGAGGLLAAHGVAAGWPLLALIGALAAVATVVAVRGRRSGQPAWTLALPYLTIVPAMFMPLAAGIYLLTSSAWSAVENAVLLSRSRSSAGGQSSAGTDSARTAG